MLNRESGIVSSFSKVLAGAAADSTLALCVIFADVSLVADRWLMRDLPAERGSTWQRCCRAGSVVPFIIYAEVKRKWKQVFVFCIGLIVVGSSCL